MPAGLDYAVFDYAVNSGVSKAVKDLQRELGVKVDGICGTDTQQAAMAVNDLDDLITRYCERRLAFMKSLKTWKTFGKGWQRRVMGSTLGFQVDDYGVIDYAINMANQSGALAYPQPELDLPRPMAIGEKEGEIPAKAPGSEQAVTKTAEGVGAIAAGIGVSGQTIISAADQVKPHINDSVIGRLALIGFILLMIAGVGLIIWNFIEKRKEISAK